MATFAGIQLGDTSEVDDEPNPKRWQLNAYPGAQGRERLDLGTDGGRVEVNCDVFAPSLATLQAFEVTMYGFQAGGRSWPFVDNYGTFYPSVVLVLIKRTSRIKPGVSGGWMRSFKFTFEYDT